MSRISGPERVGIPPPARLSSGHNRAKASPSQLKGEIMQKSIYLAAAILLFTSAAMAEPPLAKTITVSGSASIEVKPDHATINIGVDTSDKVTVKAVAANSVLMAKVVEAVKAQGIAEKSMQTSRFSIEAQHPALKEGYGVDDTITLGYAVSNTLSIEVDDVSKVPLIIDAAVKAGANTSNSVVFEAKNRQALDDKVLADAVRAARHNAEILAAAEGAKVGKAIFINNASGTYDYAVGANGNKAMSYRLAPPVTIMAGQVDISATVTVVYTLE